MIRDDLPKLWPVLRQLFRLEENDELARQFIGYARKDPLTGQILHKKPGIFSRYSITEVSDAIRDWSIDNAGVDPRAYNGRGWKEIRFALSEAERKRNQKALRQSELEQLQELYRMWPEWEYPGDAFLRDCVERRIATPLQKHVIRELSAITDKLAESFGEDASERKRLRQYHNREQVRIEIVREQMEKLYQSGALKRPPDLDEIIARSAKWEADHVRPGYAEPWEHNDGANRVRDPDHAIGQTIRQTTGCETAERQVLCAPLPAEGREGQRTDSVVIHGGPPAGGADQGTGKADDHGLFPVQEGRIEEADLPW